MGVAMIRSALAVAIGLALATLMAALLDGHCPPRIEVGGMLLAGCQR